MNDREKVVSEFERCIGSFSPADTSDEYFMCVCKRALELLEDQEPVRPKAWAPKGQTMAMVRGYYCPVCDTNVVRGDRFCHWCGRELTWD